VIELPAETPVVRTERLLLRPKHEGDIEGRQACGRDPEIMRMFGETPEFTTLQPMSRAEAEEFYEWFGDPDNPLMWVVEHEGRFVGITRLVPRAVDHKARFAVGLLDRRVHGRGLGQELTRGILRYAFNELGLHRVDLKVLSINAPAIHCYERCGFREEGREREACHVGDEWYDDVIMGILRSDYAPG
jgi:RimJ/RimL family protein N-acetyltransferase